MMKQMIYGISALAHAAAAVTGRAAVAHDRPPAGGSLASMMSASPHINLRKPGDPDIEPEAVTALNKMGTYLRTLTAFQVKADITRDEVTNDGQLVQFSHSTDLLAKRPNKLRAQMTSDRTDRVFLYDGAHFTIFAPRMNFYATVPAPGTIGALADSLDSKYDIELPLVDLFQWGTDAGASALKSATDVGASDVNGITCEQYAFRQDDLDWQVWIQKGDNALPLKVVLTTLDDDARPQYSATYTWNLAPSYNDDAFAFTPPADSHKIPLTGEAIARAIKKP